MEKIISFLRKETAELETQLYTKTEEYCENYKNYVLKFKGYTDLDWCEFFGWTPKPYNRMLPNALSIPSSAFYSKEYSKMKNIQMDIWRFTKNTNGYEDFVAKEMKVAKKHYEDSLYKLAERLVKKGLDLNTTPKVISKRLAVNLEMILEFEVGGVKKRVNCYTIIAEGPIQRAHYRFLVK
jgi:hypothetical protein